MGRLDVTFELVFIIDFCFYRGTGSRRTTGSIGTRLESCRRRRGLSLIKI